MQCKQVVSDLTSNDRLQCDKGRFVLLSKVYLGGKARPILQVCKQKKQRFSQQQVRIQAQQQNQLNDINSSSLSQVTYGGGQQMPSLRASQVTGLDIISRDSGTKYGQVDDFFVDPASLKVVGFSVAKNKKVIGFVWWQQVFEVGDVILIKQEYNPTQQEQYITQKSMKLIDCEVFTYGEFLGLTRDFIFDIQYHNVVRVLYQQGSNLSFVPLKYFIFPLYQLEFNDIAQFTNSRIVLTASYRVPFRSRNAQFAMGNQNGMAQRPINFLPGPTPNVNQSRGQPQPQPQYTNSQQYSSAQQQYQQQQPQGNPNSNNLQQAAQIQQRQQSSNQAYPNPKYSVQNIQGQRPNLQSKPYQQYPGQQQNPAPYNGSQGNTQSQQPPVPGNQNAASSYQAPYSDPRRQVNNNVQQQQPQQKQPYYAQQSQVEEQNQNLQYQQPRRQQQQQYNPQAQSLQDGQAQKVTPQQNSNPTSQPQQQFYQQSKASQQYQNDWDKDQQAQKAYYMQQAVQNDPSIQPSIEQMQSLNQQKDKNQNTPQNYKQVYRWQEAQVIPSDPQYQVINEIQNKDQPIQYDVQKQQEPVDVEPQEKQQKEPINKQNSQQDQGKELQFEAEDSKLQNQSSI